MRIIIGMDGSVSNIIKCMKNVSWYLFLETPWSSLKDAQEPSENR